MVNSSNLQKNSLQVAVTAVFLKKMLLNFWMQLKMVQATRISKKIPCLTSEITLNGPTLLMIGSELKLENGRLLSKLHISCSLLKGFAIAKPFFLPQ